MAYRNNTLPGAYNDLEYANYTPVVPMRPIKELTDLYKVKQQDYIYAKDSTSKLSAGVVNSPHTADDEGAIRQINQEVQDVLDKWEQQGDYENKVLDVDKLVQDTTKKLIPLQQKAAQESKWLETALARDKDGKYIHDPNDVKKARVLNSKINKPSVYDPELGTYIGSFTGVDVPINKNYSEEVDRVLKGWEKNEIVLNDPNTGLPLEHIPNSGYIKAGTKIYNDRAELINAAKLYLMSDPDFKHKMQFDISYDLATLTDANGNPREVTMEDINNLSPTAIQSVAKAYDLKSGIPLVNQLVDKQIPLEEFYSNVKIEDTANRTIELGVSKNDFEVYKNTYLKDDLLLNWQKNNTKGGVNNPIDTGYTSITKIASANLLHPADYNNIKEGLNASVSNLQQANIDYNKAIQSGTASPKDLEQLKDNVDNVASDKENFERQLKSLRTHIETESNFDFEPTYNEYVNKIKTQRRNKLLFNEGRTTREEVEKEFPILPFEDYKSSVIESFINKDYTNVAESTITRNDAGRIDYAAEQLAKAYGGDVETKPYNVDYHTFNVEGESKDATLYRGFIKNRKAALQMSPETFVNGKDNIFTLLDKEGIKDADIIKSDLHFLVENVNRKPAYAISLVNTDGKPIVNKNGGQKKIIVNYTGDLLDDRNVVNNIVANEAYNRFKDSDLENLSITDKAILKKLSLAYFDNSTASKYFDDLNLYAATDGEKLPYYINGKTSVNQKPDMIISTRKNIVNPTQLEKGEAKSYVSDLVYNIELPDGRLLSQDDNGSTTWTYKGEGNPITFNSPSEIKEELGTSLLIEKMNQKESYANPYAVQPTNSSNYGTSNLRDIFGNDITTNTVPYVTTSTYNHIKALKQFLPTLYVTEGSREYNSSLGSKTSKHKEGKALDVRINEASKKLMLLYEGDLTREELRKMYGIVLVEPHNGEKGVARTAAEADHLHIEFE